MIINLAERQYPPKLMNLASTETTATGELSNILPTTFDNEELTIDPYYDGYGIGKKTLYSSTTWSSSATNFI